jgi:hypothetical protein
MLLDAIFRRTLFFAAAYYLIQNADKIDTYVVSVYSALF